MSGSTEDLRRRIGGAQDLSGVVRSMKAVAASSIGQYERAVESLKIYSRTVDLGLAACLAGGAALPPATAGWPAVRSPATGVILFGSDQGLVGRFNEVLLEFAAQSSAALPGPIATVWAVGERMQAACADVKWPEPRRLRVPASVNAITALVGQLLVEIEAAQEKGQITRVYIYHNRPKRGAGYEPFEQRLLPLDELWRGKLAGQAWPTQMRPEVIPDRAAALPAFVRGYLFVLLFQACAESLASENASRLGAMQRAEKNIDEIVAGLNRSYHRIRQEGIDEELFDVIAGYEALAHHRDD